MKLRRLLLPLLLAAGAALVAWSLRDRFAAPARQGPERSPAAPVEVAPVERGRIAERRTFSGTLIPRAQFMVAPKVAGRIETLLVDVGDEVAPGAVVARLDDDEFRQAMLEAEAELEVARARVALARSALDVAQSTYDRVIGLQQIEIASGSELDVADADLRARQAQVAVAEAEVQRASAALEAARVRLGYATVTATWSGSEAPRVVAERWFDPGATVAANAPIAMVVDLASVRAVLSVPERDYARLAPGQVANVRTDAWPGVGFAGTVSRLSPVFEAATRQMRVEVEIQNPDRRLRPGMFVRVEITLAEAADAVIVPEEALVERGGTAARPRAARGRRPLTGLGVFAVNPDRRSVRWTPVRTGIAERGRVQVFAEPATEAPLDGDVVVLGQQLLEDGAAIRIPPRLDEGADATSDG